MKIIHTLSLRGEMIKEAEEIQKELSQMSLLEDTQIPERLDKVFGAKIRAYENEKRKKKIPRKFLYILAATIILLVGTSISAIGNKSYLKEMRGWASGERLNTVMNVKDMETLGTEDLELLAAYHDIKEEIGISAVRFGERPAEMIFEDVQIFQEKKMAKLFYRYDDEIIQYMMYLNDEDSSLGVEEVDKKLSETQYSVNGETVMVREYQVENMERSRYEVLFDVGGVHYRLTGVMGKEEIEKLIKNLQIF